MQPQVTGLPPGAAPSPSPFPSTSFLFPPQIGCVYVKCVRRQWFGREDYRLWCSLSCLRSFLSSRRRVSLMSPLLDFLMVSQLHVQRCHELTLRVRRVAALCSDQITLNNPRWQSETKNLLKEEKLEHHRQPWEPLVLLRRVSRLVTLSFSLFFISRNSDVSWL